MQLRRLGILFLILQIVLSCVSAPKKKPAQPAPFDAKKELSKIQIDVAAGSDQRAITRLKNLMTRYPKTDVANDAGIQLGKIYFARGQYDLAYQTDMGLVNSDIFSPNEGDALLGAAHALHKLGRLDEALSLNARGLKIPGLSEGLKLDFYKHRFNLLTTLGDRMDAIRTLGLLYEHETKADMRANLQARAIEMVYRQLTLNELEKLVDTHEADFVRPQASYRLGMFRLAAKDFDGARTLFQRAAEFGQGTPVQRQAESYLMQIDSRRRVDAFTIGAVLPLTGRAAPVAQKTLRGLQLGLGVYGDRSNFKLAVVDSEGTPEGARRAVERLVGEDNVIAIVGSLLSKEASAVAQKTEELGVPSIALSQKSGLTEGASYVFRNAVTSEMQVRELVRLAMDQLGYKRFAVLYPNDPYGVEYANIFWDEVLARGGQVTGAQVYNPNETDFRNPIRRLVGTYYLEDRTKEYEERVKDWFKKQKSLKTRNSPPDDLLPPIADFDAIFVPDSPKALGQIAPMLAYQGINNVRLLGTNIWNTTELARRGGKNIEKAVFIDSNINSDPNFKTSRFYQDYKRIFGEDPGLFEAQGYEVGLLLRQLIQGGDTNRVSLAQAMTNIKQYQGVSGPMSMNMQRELVRPLIPLTVNQGSIVTWNPSFEVKPEEAVQPPTKGKTIKK